MSKLTRNGFNTERAYEHIKNLSFPRLAGTSGEKKARDYIYKSLIKMELIPELEYFTYSSFTLNVVLPAIFVMLGIINLVATFLYFKSSIYLGIPIFFQIVSSTLLFRWTNLFEFFKERGRKRLSQNIVARTPATKTVRNIFLLAHYDSKSQVMPVALRYISMLLAAIIGIILMIVFLIKFITILAGWNFASWTFIFYTGIFVTLLFFFLAFNISRNKSDGALDDAAGCGILLELGNYFIKNPLKHSELHFIFTGCEEYGLMGAIGYWQMHQNRMNRNTDYIINFDIPFSEKGKISLNKSFGLPPKFTSKKLNKVISDIADKKNIELAFLNIPLGAAADHFIFANHGFETVAFISKTLIVHTERDNIDIIKLESIRDLGSLSIEFIEKIDKEDHRPKTKDQRPKTKTVR